MPISLKLKSEKEGGSQGVESREREIGRSREGDPEREMKVMLAGHHDRGGWKGQPWQLQWLEAAAGEAEQSQ